jgi:hypothetical protein
LNPRSTSPTPEEILAAIVAEADDGFCARSALALRFRRVGARDLRKAIARAVRAGYVLERRGPDQRLYLALSSEGWERFRAGPPGQNPA